MKMFTNVTALFCALLFSSISVQAQDTKTQLERALSRCNSQETEEALRKGANPNVEVRSKPALMNCLKQPFITKMLLDAGASPHLIDKASGRTALIEAVHTSRFPSAFLLLEADADVNTLDNYERSALFFAAENSNGYNMIDALLEAGAKVDQQNRGGVTPLMRAARNGKAANVELLLEAGANVKAVDRKGLNVVWHIVRQGSGISALQLVVKHGADINHPLDYSMIEWKKAGKKNTPLVSAVAAKKDAALIEVMIDLGANQAARNGNDETLLEMAKRNSHREVERLLQL